MPSSPTVIFMVIFLLESLAAMLQNGFMVTVLGREWMRCRALPAADMIVSCLAASRFCLHGITVLNSFLVSFYVGCMFYYFSILWTFINTVTCWLTTWLAVFYCVKISSFSHPIFVWLKWRISQLVPRLLLGSLLIGGLSTISSAIGNTTYARMTSCQISLRNSTLVSRLEAFHQRHFLPQLVLTFSVPFLLFVVSAVLLMFSLCWHLRQMTNCRAGPRDPSTQAHTKALKSLTFLLIFHTWHFLSTVISVRKSTVSWDHWHLAQEVMIYAGISLHSTILMLSSPKLRKALKMKPEDASSP
ncbi:PREDICTED: taste receptor type 2 member 62-like [Galeopterus variegatus]|uniref:Taste receptor type 2 n=1 Tax=Galeopterus variegatus TaxID=482537 RepID=A0ABM0S0W8_GALVR|nr:PREDICTED: taste receptor type 2 member 62-like [Galeopterus variegatus]